MYLLFGIISDYFVIGLITKHTIQPVLVVFSVNNELFAFAIQVKSVQKQKVLLIAKMEQIAETADTLSHDDLLQVTKCSLVDLLRTDSLLSDLPSDIILEEILSLTAVEHGQSICIYISREDEPPLKVIVSQNATVRELKKAIARHFEIYQQRTGNKVKISWRYIWRTYDLSFDSLLLDENNSCLGDYGVTNKITLSFKKKRKKNKV